jgi:6-phosphogluconolactonase
MQARTLAVGALALTAFVTFSAQAIDLRASAVFLMTNQVDNAVIAYHRDPNGTLRPVGEFPTGGSGNPVPQAGDPLTDPLASQGSLVLSDDGRFLYAVNAGSHQISVFEVRKTGLRLIENQRSGGKRPISVTARGTFLYVLNEGATPNVAGFSIDDETGRLTYLEDSTRKLPSAGQADPAQIAFNPTGKTLVLTQKATNLIVTWRVRLDGYLQPPVITPSNGITPFGFGFDSLGHLIVSEAAAGVDDASSVSSYQFLPGGIPETVSASIPNSQTAACWVVVTVDDSFVYVSNTGSGQVSSYSLQADGSISLLNGAASNTTASSKPIDMALSRDGQNLYVHQAGRRGIAVFEINPDGSLNRRSQNLGLPLGAQGIAAN